MLHQFYRLEINLDLYQYREIPQAIVPYEERFEGSLFTEILRFQREFHWKEMWLIPEARARLKAGYKLWVLRPKNQIKGWVWLSPEGEIKNLYVSKWFRNKGWGEQLIYQALNGALDLDMDDVFARIDIWNDPSKAVFETVLNRISCKSSYKYIEENY